MNCNFAVKLTANFNLTVNLTVDDRRFYNSVISNGFDVFLSNLTKKSLQSL